MINHSDLLQLCRLCLVDDEVTHSIFEETGDLKDVFLKITSCLSVSISRDDNLPKKICNSCSTKLDSFYKFWNDAATSEKQLQQWLQQLTLNNQEAQLRPEKNNSKKQVKEEAMDGQEETAQVQISSEAKTYILQQQQLPYAPPVVEENEEPVRKRPKRASAMKALEQLESDDDSRDNYAKIQSDDNSEKEDEENYQEGPSTSMDDQPGPSGVGKGPTEASDICVKKTGMLTRRNATEFSIKLEEGTICSRKKRKYRRDDPKKIPCKICNRRFTFNHLLKVHSHFDVSRKEFKCTLCGNSSLTNDTMKKHMHEKHSNQVTYLECSQCNKKYTYQGDLSRHIKNKHESFTYKCELCDQAFNSDRDLKQHSALAHEATYVKPKHPCNLCEKVFSCRKSMLLHAKNVHHGLRTFYVCDMCGKSLATPNSFRNHMRTHTKDKPFPCETCGKRFGRNHHLQDHLVTHTKEKPHICFKCGRAYTQRAPLLRHIKCAHETARPFQCLICLKSFATKSLVHAHSKLHNVIN